MTTAGAAVAQAAETRPAIVPDEVPARPTLLRNVTRDRLAVVGVVMLLVILGAVLAAPWLAPSDPNAVDTPHRLEGWSRRHPLGTDTIGRDMASRLLHGGRASVTMAVAATTGITLLGLGFGVVAGMLGGVVDNVIMRVVEVVQALPMLIVAMVAIGLWGGGAAKLIVVFAVVGWPGYARVVRASTLVIRERPFVDAARALGASKSRLMVRHVLPNLVASATVLSTLDLGRIVLGLTALSFLGFGVQPPDPEWGAMIADARSDFYLAPRLLIEPGLAISLLVLAVNLAGDGLRDALDVKVRPR